MNEAAFITPRWSVVILLLGLIGGLFLLPGVRGYLTGQNTRVSGNAESANQNVPAVVTLQSNVGPVIERVINSYGADAGNQGLNFTTGMLISIPERKPYDDTALFKWVTEHGVDLLAANKGGFKGTLVGPKLRLAPIPEQQWDEVSTNELRQALDRAKMKKEGGWSALNINDRLNRPLTFAFEADSEAVGLLQILSFTDSPRGMKVRYKRVRRDLIFSTATNSEPAQAGK